MRRLSLLVAACVLSACGSSGYDDAPAPPPAPVDPPVAGTQVPTSATTSSAGATTFVRTTSSAGDDAAEPLELGTALLASSETDEPAD